ncbi:IclR family transcriptional regulator [Jannaschia sp. LMIT008]|uniref:IclR family transcriptional regulator n=1 Tax=Jannaschia maritima TaxID=3032585 RepID=UPI002811A183|nr:IclR family transcriptional regulator [Jannaschia sp. LMIT008]
MHDGDTGGTIPTNLRLLLVLEAVARAGVPVTPTEVNIELGLPKPTIHRLFATLEAEGFLQREMDGRTYAPGRRVRRLAGGVLSSQRIRTARRAILKRLTDRVGETCNIALPDSTAMIYIERLETEWPLRIQLPIGTRVPLYCTASGKMYLSTLSRVHLERYLAASSLVARTANTLATPEALSAELDRIRTDGYAVDREEFMDDMTAVAVPIQDPHRRLLATLSIHAPTMRLSTDMALGHLGILQAAASDLSRLVSDDMTTREGHF